MPFRPHLHLQLRHLHRQQPPQHFVLAPLLEVVSDTQKGAVEGRETEFPGAHVGLYFEYSGEPGGAGGGEEA